MKICLIYPPLWDCDCPYPSLAYLYANLKDRAEIDLFDWNIEFNHYMFSKGTLENKIDGIKKLCETEKNIQKLEVFQRAIGLSELTKLNSFEDSILCLQNTHKIEEIKKAKLNLEIGRYIYSAKYFPISLVGSRYSGKRKLETITELMNEVDDMNNPFIEFITEESSKKICRYDMVGISITSLDQLVAGFTVAKRIKGLYPDTKILVGGAVMPYLYDAIKNFKGIIPYIDVFSFGEGETPLNKYLDFLELKCDIEDVPNILFIENGAYYESQKKSFEKMNQINPPDYSQFHWERYFLPERIITYISSRGCHWQKCAFCSLTTNYGQQYRPRSMDKVIADIKKLKKENNSSFFMIDDEAMSQNRLLDLSRRLIEEKVDITWICLSRFDNNMEKSTLEMAYNAGLKIVSYGLESGSQTLLDKMNKGIDIEKANKILEDSTDTGIWNNVFMFFGFPLEKKKDIDLTIEFVNKNKSSIDSLAYGKFRLEKNSNVFLQPHKYSIQIKDYPPDYYLPEYEFEYVGEAKYEIDSIIKFENEIVNMPYYHQNFFCIDLRRIFILLAYQTKSKVKNIFNNILEHRIKISNLKSNEALENSLKVNSHYEVYRLPQSNEGYKTVLIYNKSTGRSTELHEIYVQFLHIFEEKITLYEGMMKFNDLFGITENSKKQFVDAVILLLEIELLSFA